MDCHSYSYSLQRNFDVLLVPVCMCDVQVVGVLPWLCRLGVTLSNHHSTHTIIDWWASWSPVGFAPVQGTILSFSNTLFCSFVCELMLPCTENNCVGYQTVTLPTCVYCVFKVGVHGAPIHTNYHPWRGVVHSLLCCDMWYVQGRGRWWGPLWICVPCFRVPCFRLPFPSTSVLCMPLARAHKLCVFSFSQSVALSLNFGICFWTCGSLWVLIRLISLELLDRYNLLHLTFWDDQRPTRARLSPTAKVNMINLVQNPFL